LSLVDLDAISPTLWWIVLGLVGLAVIGCFAAWVHLRYWERKLGVPMAYALEERIATEDGSAIEIRRLGAPRRTDAPPVLLVHGLGANHRNHDVHPDFSLARFLFEQGRDVWLLTLRSGRSDRTWRETRRLRFAQMAEHDVPLGVSTVLARTHATSLDYIGFSMGGMLLYAALARSLPESQIRRAVVIGSPALVRVPLTALFWWLRFVPHALFPTLRLRLMARLGAFAAEWIRTPAHRLVYNPLNTAAGVARVGLVNVIEDVPGPLQAELARWAIEGGDIRVAGERVVDGLANVGVPALFFAGAADRIAPLAAVERAFDAWGALRPETHKELVILGTTHGAKFDYGHGDLALGANVREEIFERIERFLDEAL